MSFEKRNLSFTLRELIALHRRGSLNLEPGFQRKSVWNDSERRLLIDSIVRGLPVPSLLLWERRQGGKTIYDVIDGKQRIEAIIAFVDESDPLQVLFKPEDGDLWRDKTSQWWFWSEIEETEKDIKSCFLRYELPSVVVNGSLEQVEQIFIRINSTGKRLTRHEILHAKWYKGSELLAAAEKLAGSRRYLDYFIEMRILGKNQITRMKGAELITELMVTIHHESVLDRKKVLDKVIGNSVISSSDVAYLVRSVKYVLDLIRKIFPGLNGTRFSNPSDFYALAFVIWKMNRDGFYLEDTAAAEIALRILKDISFDLAEYRSRYREGGRPVLKSPALEYHRTVLEATDSARHRKERVRIIEELLYPIFPMKDSRRLFSKEQKLLLWHSTKNKTCCNKSCKRRNPVLTWNDVTIDHIKAYSKGGRTNLSNAQLMCSSCNSSKGSR